MLSRSAIIGKSKFIQPIGRLIAVAVGSSMNFYDLDYDISYNPISNLAGDIFSIDGDSTDWFVAHYNSPKLVKINKLGYGVISALTSPNGIANPTYGGSAIVDTDSLYINGYGSSFPIQKYSKSILARIDSTGGRYGGAWHSIAQDDTYIYCGMNNNSTSVGIQRRLKSTIATVIINNFETIASRYVYSVGVDDTYVYTGGNFTGAFKIFNKSDLTLVTFGGTIGSVPYRILTDNTYVYVLTNSSSSGLYIINKTTLNIDYQITGFYGTDMDMDDDFIYCGVGSTLKTLAKSDFSTISNIKTFSSTIRAVKL